MGYHSDIGGGIRGEDLAHFPLAWMMSKLEPFIDFDETNFWNPRPKETKWKVDGQESGKNPPCPSLSLLLPSMSSLR